MTRSNGATQEHWLPLEAVFIEAFGNLCQPPTAFFHHPLSADCQPSPWQGESRRAARWAEKYAALLGRDSSPPELRQALID